jgi:hypothetical protein
MGFTSSLLAVALTIYGSQSWSTALDWIEVVFADFDFASDVLFCLEAHRVYSICNPHLSGPYFYLSKSCPAATPAVQRNISSNLSLTDTLFRCEVSDDDCCLCGLATLPFWTLNCACNGTSSWSSHKQGTLEGIWICSVIFIVIPVTINLSIIFFITFNQDESLPLTHRNDSIKKNVVALHDLIKTPLLNPFFFLFYFLLHMINILLIATSGERLAKILMLREDIEPKNQKKGIARITTYGFILETVPQIVCQGIFISITGANITAIVSVSISSYRAVSSYMYKVFHALFPHATEPAVEREQARSGI